VYSKQNSCDVTKVNHLEAADLQQILCNLFALNKSPDVLQPQAVPIYQLTDRYGCSLSGNHLMYSALEAMAI
jgi:hypothetical protein